MIGVPTIIFVDKDDYDFTDEFKEIISMLHSVSIFHYSIEAAAKEVSSINCDVSSWWRDGRRSDMLENVLGKIAKKSECLAYDWAEELKRVSKKAYFYEIFPIFSVTNLTLVKILRKMTLSHTLGSYE